MPFVPVDALMAAHTQRTQADTPARQALLQAAHPLAAGPKTFAWRLTLANVEWPGLPFSIQEALAVPMETTP